VVTKLDRLARSLPDARAIADELTTRQISLSLGGSVYDPTDAVGRLLFNVLAMVAEFIRELIVAGTHEGLAVARARGRVGGRPSVVTPDIIRAARDMLPNPEHSITSIAKLLGVSPGTLYNHIPDLRELRAGSSQ
jgi:DNA invertase Pin-like site-specific DNA recombinase